MDCIVLPIFLLLSLWFCFMPSVLLPLLLDTPRSSLSLSGPAGEFVCEVCGLCAGFGSTAVSTLACPPLPCPSLPPCPPLPCCPALPVSCPACPCPLPYLPISPYPALLPCPYNPSCPQPAYPYPACPYQYRLYLFRFTKFGKSTDSIRSLD